MAIGQAISEFLHWVGLFLYDLANSLGGFGLFLVALADSSFLSVPEGNDLLIVVLSMGQSFSLMTYYVTMTVLGSISGCSLLYWVGRRGGRSIGKPARRKKLEVMQAKYQRWGVWAVLVPSILPPPTPFKVFVLSAGLFRLPFQKFLLAVAVGRSIRYFMWGILAVLYGELVKEFIQQNLATVGLVLLGLFLILGILYFMVQSRKKRIQMGTLS